MKETVKKRKSELRQWMVFSKKRGHTSLKGVVTAMGSDTVKVAGVAVLSKRCKCPNKLERKQTVEGSVKRRL